MEEAAFVTAEGGDGDFVSGGEGRSGSLTYEEVVISSASHDGCLWMEGQQESGACWNVMSLRLRFAFNYRGRKSRDVGRGCICRIGR
jgi:hypothetical protein